MPKAVAKAVNTVMAIFRILLQRVLFSFSISIVDVGTLRAIVGTLRAALKPNVIANPDVARYVPTLVNNIKNKQ